MIERPPSSQEKTVDSAIIRIPVRPKTYMYAFWGCMIFLACSWLIPWGMGWGESSGESSWGWTVVQGLRWGVLPLAIVVCVVMDHVKRGKEAFQFYVRVAGVLALIFIALAAWLLYGLKNFA